MIDPDVYASAYEWYTSGPRQRMQPNGAIVIVMTRWHKGDLTGRVLRHAAERADGSQWEIIEFPAILNEGTDEEKSIWPGYWTLESLQETRADLSIHKWMAQYQQNPTSDTGAIIKREWWQDWELDDPPQCDFIIQSWDTAFLATERADFSACTTWGVFEKEDPKTGESTTNIILMDALQERLEFPDLKEKAIKMYEEWEPDAFIVEAKASGAPLVFELRRLGIPVVDFTPVRGRAGHSKDKVARCNSVADIFASGMVWAPKRKRWAEEVIETFSDFPHGEHDDLVDSGVMALMRFRQGGFIEMPSDFNDTEPMPVRNGAYY
jgi:predicted phage terminase large subunit-like protein